MEVRDVPLKEDWLRNNPYISLYEEGSATLGQPIDVDVGSEAESVNSEGLPEPASYTNSEHLQLAGDDHGEGVFMQQSPSHSAVNFPSIMMMDDAGVMTGMGELDPLSVEIQVK